MDMDLEQIPAVLTLVRQSKDGPQQQTVIKRFIYDDHTHIIKFLIFLVGSIVKEIWRICEVKE
jgi:hypothetical protein